MGLQDDIVYLLILVASTGLAHLSKKRSVIHSRAIFNGGVGLALVLLVCHAQILYSLLQVLVTLGLVAVLPRRWLFRGTFVWAFGWLSFTRVAWWFGLPSLLPHANAVQLIMTLRVVGLAAEVSDSNSEHSLTQLFLYAYNFVGLFTGPYYTLRVHEDMVKAEDLERVKVSSELRWRLSIIPVYIGGFLLLRAVFPLEHVKEDAFYETSFLWRLFYMVPSFQILKLRCYVAWHLAEVGAIANGLGAYPAETKPRVGQGPTLPARTDNGPPQRWSFETVRNVDPYNVELSRGFRSGMRAWNRSVQFWLATFIYARSPRSVRLPLTMLVSAVWHGYHPGYFLSFLTIPLATAAEDAVAHRLSKFQRDEDDSIPQRPADLVWWFIRERSFEYMSMGFLLIPGYSHVLRYFLSIGFCIHFLLAAIIIMEKISSPRVQKHKTT